MLKRLVFLVVFTLMVSSNVFAGLQAGLNWDRPVQLFTVICHSSATARVYLVNASNGTNGGNLTMTAIHFIGADSSDFSITGNQMGYSPLNEAPPWPLSKNDSVW